MQSHICPPPHTGQLCHLTFTDLCHYKSITFTPSPSSPLLSHLLYQYRMGLIHCLSLVSLLLLVHTTESTQPPFSCDASNPSTKSFPFCQTSLPIRKRVQDLVSRLTLDEKISQLVNTAPPIPRLGIPGYQWWSEALHGVANVGPGIHFNGAIKAATSFPQVILTAASFDTHLWYRIGQVSPLNHLIRTI